MNQYHVVCERTLSGYSTPDVIMREASLNKVLDILLDPLFKKKKVSWSFKHIA